MDTAGESLMRKLTFELSARVTTMTAFAVFGLALVSFSAPLTTNQVLAAYQETGPYAPLTVLYPDNDTVFPPEIIPCTFSWREHGGKSDQKSDHWLVLVRFGDDPGRMAFLCSQPEWTPTAGEWGSIKRRCRGKQAQVTVLGFQRAAPGQILSRGRVQITTSEDPVGAPLFYREVNLPFADAVRDPSRIRWRFGDDFFPGAAAGGAGAITCLRQLPFLFRGWKRAGDGC